MDFLTINLTVGKYESMEKTTASEAARLLARRSVNARRERWGEQEFQRRMREWGKLGGRPRKHAVREEDEP